MDGWSSGMVCRSGEINGVAGQAPSRLKAGSPCELCNLSDDIYDYHYVSQGKVTVPSIDDREDMIHTYYSHSHAYGQHKFKQRGREEQAEPDGTEAGDLIGPLLGTPSEELYKNLCKPKIKVGAEFVTQGRNVAQVSYSVGALAKALFDRLFKWIVKKCNQTLETGMKRAMFIGVLDIAGFEIFDVSSYIEKFRCSNSSKDIIFCEYK
ncbi:myosin heavy chain, muscle-like [Penaeus monodon]|uniref:myosin heavy chain, muscle-like n=1 Tax=Penaeus monodon TaxID=6687 RepID=UPI0018A761F7|nr:myosin heavy chain, muscle-like [Penaeus monodon]